MPTYSWSYRGIVRRLRGLAVIGCIVGIVGLSALWVWSYSTIADVERVSFSQSEGVSIRLVLGSYNGSGAFLFSRKVTEDVHPGGDERTYYQTRSASTDDVNLLTTTGQSLFRWHDKPSRTSGWRKEWAGFILQNKSVTNQPTQLQRELASPRQLYATTYTNIGFAVPYWFMILLLSIVPAHWTFRVARDRRRSRQHRCRSCGYDLRATPERCPECGAVPAAPAWIA